MTPTTEPLWLECGPDPVLALLDRPEPASAQPVAVLFCPPFGWDEMCSYRGRRDWARRLAASGYPCARIALPGTGDSGGSPRDGARLRAWIEAISGSAAWLRAATGSERLVALGIGLGGLLACVAAREGAPIDDFVLWDVRASASALLRQLRAQAAVIAARYPEDARAPSQDGDLELTGFVISAETARDLEGIRALAPGARPDRPRRVLLLGRDRVGVDRRLREQLEQCGAEVTVREGPDYGALINHPQESTAPAKTIHETVAWLSAGRADPPVAPRSLPGPPPSLPGPAAPEVTDRAWVTPRRGAPTVRESAVQFSGELAGTFAIVTESSEAEAAPVSAVWLNGGALHHIGPNRAWVEIARRWAARGVTTVRVDVPGIGESDGDDHPPIPTDSLYYADRTRATLAILDELAARGLGDRFILGGLCSGAYWALHAALADTRVAGAMLLNLWAFFWSEALVAERSTERSLQALRGRAWQRLVRGQVTRAQVREAIGSLAPARLRAGGGYPVQRAQAPHIEAALDQLRDQGTETLLLLCRGEALYEQLARQQVLDRLERWPNFRVAQVPTRDHMFRATWLQRHVHESLDAALDRVLAAARQTTAPGLRP